MRTFAKLFGHSPFGPLQTHMDRVSHCVEKASQLLVSFEEGKWKRIGELAVEISELEHTADQVKNDLRNHLPKSLFMPVDRASLLDILSIQDAIADTAEDIGVLLGLKEIPFPDSLRESFQRFRELNLEAFHIVKRIIDELDELLESGFGGAEAERVRLLVQDVALKEHQVDLEQRTLLKELLGREDEISYGDFYLWVQLIRRVGGISNLSENLAERVLMTLELK